MHEYRCEKQINVDHAAVEFFQFQQSQSVINVCLATRPLLAAPIYEFISCHAIAYMQMECNSCIECTPVQWPQKPEQSNLNCRTGINFYWSHIVLAWVANNAVFGPISPTNSWHGFLYGHKAVNSFVRNAQWITYMLSITCVNSIDTIYSTVFCLSLRPYLLFHSTHTVFTKEKIVFTLSRRIQLDVHLTQKRLAIEWVVVFIGLIGMSVIVRCVSRSRGKWKMEYST